MPFHVSLLSSALHLRVISLLVYLTGFGALCSTNASTDWRHITNGVVLGGLDTGYSDQPNCIVTSLSKKVICTVTASPDSEGNGPEHVIVTSSTDGGSTWGPAKTLIPHVPLQNAYSTLFETTSGAILLVFGINSDNVTHLNGKPIERTDMLGHFKVIASDDDFTTWTAPAELPVRATSIDSSNSFHGSVLMHWEVDKGIGLPAGWFSNLSVPARAVSSRVDSRLDASESAQAFAFAFTKIGRYVIEPPTSSWLLVIPDADFQARELLRFHAAGQTPPPLITITLPEGGVGVRSWPVGHPGISSEPHLIPLPPGQCCGSEPSPSCRRSLALVFRTTSGLLGSSCSEDGGIRWGSSPSPWAFTAPDPGRGAYAARLPLRNPRGPITPRLLLHTQSPLPRPGAPSTIVLAPLYVLLYYHNGNRSYLDRNPYWIVPAWPALYFGQEGGIVFGQPEICLYEAPSDRAARGPGYPDFVEDPTGGLSITETNKSIARLHRIPPLFISLLARQRSLAEKPLRGLVTSIGSPGKPIAPAARFPAPPIPVLAGTGSSLDSFSFDVTFRVPPALDGTFLSRAESVILFTIRSSHSAYNDAPSISLTLSRSPTNSNNSLSMLVVLRAMSGASLHAFLPSDCMEAFGHLLELRSLIQLGVVVDGGSAIVTMVLNGRVCAGDGEEIRGWWFLPSGMLNQPFSSSPLLIQFLPNPASTTVWSWSWWNRSLMHTELIGLHRLVEPSF